MPHNHTSFFCHTTQLKAQKPREKKTEPPVAEESESKSDMRVSTTNLEILSILVFNMFLPLLATKNTFKPRILNSSS